MIRRRTILASVALVGVLAPGCSLRVFEDAPAESVTNHCAVDTDCAANARCAQGACYATEGTIDQALFEIVPDTASSLGGLSFLSSQSGLRQGSSALYIDLAPPTDFNGQVRVPTSDLGLPIGSSACAYVSANGRASIPARVDFIRTSQIAGVRAPGIPVVVTSYETQPSGNTGASGWFFPASLVPGSYDIYVQPADMPGCPSVAPYLRRNVDVGAKVDTSTAPATLDLPAGASLKGTVLRPSGSLVGWSVDLVEPIEGRVISTSTTLGETDPQKNQTNFDLTYHPVVAPPIPQGSSVTVSAMNTTSPFIRISPPKDVSGPTVYWDLAAADLNGDGLVSLDMSGVPTPAAARLVRGRVQTTSPNGDVGIPSTVIIFGSALDGATALTASWGASRHTDADGIFFVEVFSGEYRVIALPDPSLDPSASWAITETHWSLHFDQTVDALPPQTIEVLARSAVTGHASVARTNEAAAGATLEAAPSVLTSSTDVLTGALAQVPINSLSRTASIGPSGDFAMYLDPGDFDFSLKPPDGSGFAWWVRPQVRIDPATPTAMSPTLASPIAIEGTIRDPGGSPLANAVVRSYAKTPSGLGVVKVGSARTDDSGSYRLLLPVDFGP